MNPRRLKRVIFFFFQDKWQLMKMVLKGFESLDFHTMGTQGECRWNI